MLSYSDMDILRMVINQKLGGKFKSGKIFPKPRLMVALFAGIQDLLIETGFTNRIFTASPMLLLRSRATLVLDLRTAGLSARLFAHQYILSPLKCPLLAEVVSKP